MGLLMSTLHSIFLEFGIIGKDSNIIMLGLDGAGKTTLLYNLKCSAPITSVSTVGFNVETVYPTANLTFTVWDIGGGDPIRPLWHHYYTGVHGLIFVVDSSDKNRIKEASEVLSGVLRADEMSGVPLLVIANKQDLPGAMNPNDLIHELSLRQYRDRKWRIHGASAVNGDGLLESIEQFSELVKEYMESEKT